MVGHDWGKEEEEEVEWVFQMVLYQWFSTSGMTIHRQKRRSSENRRVHPYSKFNHSTLTEHCHT